MTGTVAWIVTDGPDGWDVYVTNPAGGWWLLSSVGGSAVVDTLPDGALRMVSETRALDAEGAMVQVRNVFNMQCEHPLDPADYMDEGAYWAHRWWKTVMGNVLDKYDALRGGDRRG
ncbi:MAG: hypothetical protein INR66_14980 [Gordonia polyisoprenivorans]|nr:hypothetical protein [Gordonia polyisoprenivorans]